MVMFGKRLRELRLQRNITQEELGQKLSLSKQTISGYENGTRTPDIEITSKIADFFGVSVDYLLGRDKKNIMDLPLAAHYESNLPIDDDEELLEVIERMLERRRQKKKERHSGVKEREE